ERAARGDPRALAEPGVRPSKQAQPGVEIGAPDVPAIYYAQREHFLRRAPLQESVQLPGRAHEIEMDARDRQREQEVAMLHHGLEVRGEKDVGRESRQRGVDRLKHV